MSKVAGAYHAGGGGTRTRDSDWHSMCEPEPVSGGDALSTEIEWLATPQPAVFLAVSVQVERRMVCRMRPIDQQHHALRAAVTRVNARDELRVEKGETTGWDNS